MAIIIKHKSELKIEDVDGKMTWHQVFNYYFPKMKANEIDFILWEHTCYPFDGEETLKQVYKLYEQRIESALSLT